MTNNKLLFGKTIGIIGGGQLGRMMTTTARHMGYRLVVLDPTPNCPTAQVADQHIVAEYNDLEAIKELASLVDVVTYEFENVDLEAAKFLSEKNLLPQGSKALEITQDREKEKQLLEEIGKPAVPYRMIRNVDDLKKATEELGFPAVVKTCRGGYDGKGQIALYTTTDLDDVKTLLSQNDRLIYEAFIDFDCEISVVFTRSIDGEIVYFPIAENQHRDHILHMTLAPARVDQEIVDQSKEIASGIANAIDVVGTFAIECFVKDGKVYVNELAPRPHNSGHFTIEACNVSQFEQHIRAICNLPLLPVLFHGGAVMINLLGDNLESYFSKIDQLKHAHIHMYGKAAIKEKRKLGHLTFVDQNRDQLLIMLKKQELI